MSGGANVGEAFGETLLWWAVTAGCWLATLTTPSRAELVAAAVGTLPCAVSARYARRANGGSWRFRAGWLRWATTVLREVPVQSIRVGWYALSPTGRRRSTLVVVTLPSEPEPVAAGRRAGAVLALATTPGTVVLDCVARTRRLLLHSIRTGPGRLETQVQR